eukprot:387429-Rhodomonas_salina.5
MQTIDKLTKAIERHRASDRARSRSHSPQARRGRPREHSVHGNTSRAPSKGRSASNDSGRSETIFYPADTEEHTPGPVSAAHVSPLFQEHIKEITENIAAVTAKLSHNKEESRTYMGEYVSMKQGLPDSPIRLLNEISDAETQERMKTGLDTHERGIITILLDTMATIGPAIQDSRTRFKKLSKAYAHTLHELEETNTKMSNIHSTTLKCAMAERQVHTTSDTEAGIVNELCNMIDPKQLHISVIHPTDTDAKDKIHADFKQHIKEIATQVRESHTSVTWKQPINKLFNSILTHAVQLPQVTNGKKFLTVDGHEVFSCVDLKTIAMQTQDELDVFLTKKIKSKKRHKNPSDYDEARVHEAGSRDPELPLMAVEYIPGLATHSHNGKDWQHLQDTCEPNAAEQATLKCLTDIASILVEETNSESRQQENKAYHSSLFLTLDAFTEVVHALENETLRLQDISSKDVHLYINDKPISHTDIGLLSVYLTQLIPTKTPLLHFLNQVQHNILRANLAVEPKASHCNTYNFSKMASIL